MTGRGIDFLEDWIAKNVTAAEFQGTPQRAVELADRCIAEAAAQRAEIAQALMADIQRLAVETV